MQRPQTTDRNVKVQNAKAKYWDKNLPEIDAVHARPSLGCKPPSAKRGFPQPKPRLKTAEFLRARAGMGGSVSWEFLASAISISGALASVIGLGAYLIIGQR